LDRENYKERYPVREMCGLEDNIKMNVTQVTQKGFV